MRLVEDVVCANRSSHDSLSLMIDCTIDWKQPEAVSSSNYVIPRQLTAYKRVEIRPMWAKPGYDNSSMVNPVPRTERLASRGFDKNQ